MRKIFLIVVVFVFCINTATANNYAPSADFAVCSSYAKVISEFLYNYNKKQSAILMLTRSEHFAGFAIRIGEMEGYNGELTLESINSLTSSLKKSIRGNGDRAIIVSAYNKTCPELLNTGILLKDRLWPNGPPK